MKLVGYVRVSVEEENPENQKYAIYKWASQNGHTVTDIFEDIGISGALPPSERPGFRRVLEALNNTDGVIVYALDRIARSLTELVEVVKQVEARGKHVISVREHWLQTLDPKLRELIIAILGWAGDMEREFIRTRTREALARLKAQGKRVGRPLKLNDNIVREALRYIEKGYTLRDTAKVLGVGYTTLARYITQNPTYRARYYELKARLRKL